MKFPRFGAVMRIAVVLATVALLSSFALQQSRTGWAAWSYGDVVLVTGGAGYIGSHTVLQLLASGRNVLVVDNLVNGKRTSIDRVRKLAEEQVVTSQSRIKPGKLHFRVLDVRNERALSRLFWSFSVTSCMHFAGLKAVGESNEVPVDYYDNNIVSTLVLLRVMNKYGVRKLIFSSSATVYGESAEMPVAETAPTGNGISSPYGQSKAMVEQILCDTQRASPSMNILMLRYFNPVGAHPSGQIGEDPQGTPNNLMPFVAQVAIGRIDSLTVFGKDYPTLDGTCRRDYIHIMDLVEGHVQALRKLDETHVGCRPVNLGRGEDYSVFEMIKAFEKSTGQSVRYTVGPRRTGDVPTLYANVSLAHDFLSWRAHRTLDQMVEDLWRWQAMNPNGYET